MGLLLNKMINQLAQITNPSIGGLTGMVGEGGAGFLSSLLSTVITIILAVGGLYFFFQLITGGVSWIGSGGDKAKLEEARSKLLSAGIGLILLFSAFAIITLVENVFGVGILNFDIPVIGQTTYSGGGIGDASCPQGCPANTICQNTVCVNDPNP